MVDYLSPVYWLFLTLSGLRVFVLRRRYPHAPRPFRVPGIRACRSRSSQAAHMCCTRASPTSESAPWSASPCWPPAARCSWSCGSVLSSNAEPGHSAQFDEDPCRSSTRRRHVWRRGARSSWGLDVSHGRRRDAPRRRRELDVRQPAHLADPACRGASWEIEGAPPRWMCGQGFTPESLAAGDSVTIVYHPHRSRARAGILMEVQRADGTVLKVNRPPRSAGPDR